MENALQAFEPIAGGHAIAEILVAIHFTGDFSSDQLARVAEAREQFATEFPGVEEFRSVHLKVEANRIELAQNAERPEGFAYFRAASDGTRKAVVQVKEQLLQFSLLEYRGWESTCARATSVLTSFSRAIVGAGGEVDQIAFRCLDVFNYQGDEGTYSIEDLFASDSQLIPAHLVSAGCLWHCNTGWFSSDVTLGRTLIGLNLRGVRSSDGRLQVHVDHALHRQYSLEESELAQQTATSETLLSSLLSEYHIHNKKLMRSLLATQVLDQIGLRGD